MTATAIQSAAQDRFSQRNGEYHQACLQLPAAVAAGLLASTYGDGEKAAVKRLKKHIPPLDRAVGDRWPVLLWGNYPKSLWKPLADRGLSPLFNGCHSAGHAKNHLRALRYFESRDMPLVILPQGLVQRAFRDPPVGTGCDHKPPARPESECKECTCPAWMYENPRVKKHKTRTRKLCEFLKKSNITPEGILIDFETGAYLRNKWDKEKHVRIAMEEAQKCPRCIDRFGKDNMDSLKEYRDVVNEARAYTVRTAFTEPVRSVFPNCHAGNYYAWPICRVPRPDRRYPAYGWKSSGMDVAQPRCYFVPGWGGAGDDQQQMNWNVFCYCLGRFSDAARVLKEDEILAPWVGYLFNHGPALKKASWGYKIASGPAYAEMVRHVMLRGAETIIVFNPYSLTAELPEQYEEHERAELGPWLLNVMDVQRAYAEMLEYDDILRNGEVLNYEFDGEYSRLDETAAVWSGVATDERALIRTVSFGPELTKTIDVFGKQLQLPFKRRGQFFWVTPDGEVERIEG